MTQKKIDDYYFNHMLDCLKPYNKSLTDRHDFTEYLFNKYSEILTSKFAIFETLKPWLDTLILEFKEFCGKKKIDWSIYSAFKQLYQGKIIPSDLYDKINNHFIREMGL